MTTTTAAVNEQLTQLIKNDELVLPSLPDIAIKIRHVADDFNSEISDLTALISHDPALSARLIKVANSPLMRTTCKISDLHTAISRLGMSFSSNLAIGLAMEQMFEAKSRAVNKRIHEYWQYAIEIAACAQEIAKRFSLIPPGQALLGGLIHQIGVLPILKYAEENHNELLDDADMLNEVIATLHPQLSAHILSKWQFPQEFVELAHHYNTPDRDVEQADICDLVYLATIKCHHDDPSTASAALGRLGIDSMDALNTPDFDESIREVCGAFG